MTLLSVVKVVFEIENRGCVIVPGVLPNDKVARRGSRIELRKPDGTTIQTEIVEMEFLHGVSPENRCFPILLPRDISKSDIPEGTEVWLCEPASN